MSARVIVWVKRWTRKRLLKAPRSLYFPLSLSLSLSLYLPRSLSFLRYSVTSMVALVFRFTKVHDYSSLLSAAVHGDGLTRAQVDRWAVRDEQLDAKSHRRAGGGGGGEGAGEVEV